MANYKATKGFSIPGKSFLTDEICDGADLDREVLTQLIGLGRLVETDEKPKKAKVKPEDDSLPGLPGA